MRISDWSSDVCSSDLFAPTRTPPTPPARFTPSPARFVSLGVALAVLCAFKLHTVSIPFSQGDPKRCGNSQALLQLSLSAWPPSWPPPQWRRMPPRRAEEHTSELQSLMRISYAVFCLK